MPSLDVPYDPCPFRCRECGARGQIHDRSEAPAGYVELTCTISSFVSPNNRWRPTR